MNSPKALAYQVFAGNLLVSCWFLFLCLPIPATASLRHGFRASGRSYLALFLFIQPMVVGLCLSQRAELRLSKGIKNKLLDRDDLKMLDRWFSYRWLLWIVFVAIVGGAGYVLIPDLKLIPLGWAAWFPAMTIMRIKNILSRALKDGEPGQDGGLGLNNAKPIDSRSWGSRDGSEQRLSH